MKSFSKESLIESLLEIRDRGWIPSIRPNNHGGIGNTIESLLGIEENNLPIPNASEWELKTQRKNTTSLITLFHMEPSPTAFKIVPQILLPFYGWAHKEAGQKYPESEMSFRQTICCGSVSDRGFTVRLNANQQKVEVSFDSAAVNERHSQWLKGVQSKIGSAELDPQPYWGYDDLFYKAGAKLHNTFLIQADAKKIDSIEHFRIEKILVLRHFSKEAFLKAIEQAQILVDFDARTGHNHGTKFRLRQNAYVSLFDQADEF